MNNTETKEIFYERYGGADDFLHYTFCGALCTLLGHTDILGAPFLSCSLSMGVGMFSRALGGNVTSLQSAVSDRHFSYTRGNPTAQFKGSEKQTAQLISEVGKYTKTGAQILYNSSIPSALPQKKEFRFALTSALLSAGGRNMPPLETAYIASGGEHIAPFTAMSYSRSGYCTLITDEGVTNYPLPMTGYKVVYAYCREKDNRIVDRVYDALDVLRKHCGELSVHSLNPAHALLAGRVLSKSGARYIQHLAGENSRIKAAVRGLEGCDIKALFHAMNASQHSMEKLWNIRRSHAFLARLAKNADGVAAVRCTHGGAVIIAESDKVDHMVRMIKSEFEYNMGYKPVFCITDTI